MNHKVNQRDACALQTWHQGALFTKISDSCEVKHLQCPHCAQAATAVHLLWLCKETTKTFPALNPEDQFELEHGLNLEFWAQALLMIPSQSLSTGGASVQAWGTWTTQDEASIRHSDVVTIGIAGTSTDARLKHYAVSIVHHTQIGGQLCRQGAVVAILPGKQTWERAWYYGLRMAAHYVDLQQRLVLHVQSTRAWEAWQNGKHSDLFHDLRGLITWDQKQRIKVLCISPKQLKEMPKNGWSLRNRMADAAKAAKEVALSLQPIEQEQELQAQDKKYQRIAPLVIQRIKHLLADKSHFLHEAKENGKQKRNQAREQKREIYNSLTGPQSPEHHQWAAKGTAMQCLQCKARLTMHSKLKDIKDGKDAKCDQAKGNSLVGGAASITTKAELIQQMLEGTTPNMAPRKFFVKNQYIVCETCNVRLLKHSAQEKLKELSGKPCWNQAWPGGPTWTGHGSHKMWRKGGKIWRQKCQAHAHMTEAGPTASKALIKECPKNTGQQSLPHLFRPKVD